MNSPLNTKRYNNSFGSYLTNLDLINKYNSKTLYNLPEIKKIILHFSIKDFLEALKISNKNEINSNSEIKAMLLFYIYFSLLPYINFKKIKLKNGRGRNEATNDFSLKINISNQQDIVLFLINLFVEQGDFIKQEKLFFFKQNQKNLRFQSKSICYNCALPANLFFNSDDFVMNSNEKEINFKKLSIKTSFVINNIAKSKNNNKLIRNIPFFWVNH